MQRYPRKIFKPKKHKKVLPWQHLLPGVAEKLVRSSLCRGMESKEPIKHLQVQETKKSVAMATLVASYRYKTNQLQSMQGFGMLRTPQKILKPKKHEKVLPRQHLLPDIAKKAITHKLSCH